jgi:hypothetical protein
MACKTCGGTKVKKTLAPPVMRMINRGIAQRPELVEEPCPDCTPRPFAYVKPDDHMTGDEWEVLMVAGERMTNHRPMYGGDALIETAERINAAVKAREVKLLSAVVEYLQRVGVDGPIGVTAGLCADVMKLHPDCDAVSGHVACGLAWDLGVEQAKVHDLQLMLEASVDAGRDELVPFLRSIVPTQVRSPWHAANVEDRGTQMVKGPDGQLAKARVRVKTEYLFEADARRLTSKGELRELIGDALEPWQQRLLDRLVDPPLEAGAPSRLTATEVLLRDQERAARDRADAAAYAIAALQPPPPLVVNPAVTDEMIDRAIATFTETGDHGPVLQLAERLGREAAPPEPPAPPATASRRRRGPG